MTQESARARLKSLLPPHTRVYTIHRTTSRHRMTRTYTILVIYHGDILDITTVVAEALDSATMVNSDDHTQTFIVVKNDYGDGDQNLLYRLKKVVETQHLTHERL